MLINWQINYPNRTATCSQISVSIVKIESEEQLVQMIGNIKVSLGFTKINGGTYFCLITQISSTLWKQNLEDNKLLPNYMSQLGDSFKESYFDSPLASKNQFEKVCEMCKQQFIGAKQAKFCSNRCRQANKNLKLK